MRRMMMAASGCLMLAACGGGSDGSGMGQVASVASTPATTPAPTPTPTPAPTPTATPTSAYQRYADLTGDRTFQTACASLVLGSELPSPQPALPFGQGLTLGYTAATAGWAIGGNGVDASFAASDAASAPAGQTSYTRAVAGSTQSFTITAPVAGGATLDHTRSLSLRTDMAAETSLYSCVFGVPALAADVPTAATSYARVTIDGTAYVTDANGAVQTYALSTSTGSAGYDPATGALMVTVHLLGNFQANAGTASASTDLGTFSGTGVIAGTGFSGPLDSADRVSLFSSFSGEFFGNKEAGSSFEVLATDPGTGARVAAVGTLTASR